MILHPFITFKCKTCLFLFSQSTKSTVSKSWGHCTFQFLYKSKNMIMQFVAVFLLLLCVSRASFKKPLRWILNTMDDLKMTRCWMRTNKRRKRTRWYRRAMSVETFCDVQSETQRNWVCSASTSGWAVDRCFCFLSIPFLASLWKPQRSHQQQ